MNGLLTDDDGDILIRNRSLVIGDCTADVVQRVLEAYPGEFREYPKLGCFVASQQNGTPDPFWPGNAKKQLKASGVDVDTLRITPDGEIELRVKSYEKD
jgi:hypothetical protein